jgi:hypothetical protein
MIIGWVSFYDYTDRQILGTTAKIIASVVAGAMLVFVSGSPLRFGA